MKEQPADPAMPDPPPERGSQALLEYYWASRCELRLLNLLVDSVIAGDYVVRVIGGVLNKQTSVRKDLTPAALAEEDPGPRTIALRQSRQELLEMMLGRAVDNFQVYLVQVIRDVLHKKPAILSARKQELSLGYILQFDTIESLTLDIIEAKVNSLSYEGFGDIAEWCDDRGIPLVIPDGFRDQIVELIAARNLIVHNRGFVDARYKSVVPTTDFAIGSKRTIEIDDLFAAHQLLSRVVCLSDSAIAGKFHLPLVAVRDDLDQRAKARWPRPVAALSAAPPQQPEQQPPTDAAV